MNAKLGWTILALDFIWLVVCLFVAHNNMTWFDKPKVEPKQKQAKQPNNEGCSMTNSTSDNQLCGSVQMMVSIMPVFVILTIIGSVISMFFRKGV